MYFTHLFLFGELVDPQKRVELLGRAHLYVESCRADGYCAVDDTPYPVLMVDPNGSVEGFMTIIHEDELEILEEHVTTGYVKRSIRLDNGKEAWTIMKK